LEKVAEVARSNAAKINAGELGYLVGLLHDLGKYSPDVQRERLGKKDGKRVDHSTAGAVVAERYGSIGRLVAFCIAGHHAGLANGPYLTQIKPATAGAPRSL
jgi:CRISPR-associated endonuclease/helicase Cas3